MLIVAGALLALLATTSVTWFIRHLHERSVADSYRSLSGLSTVLADQAARALQAIELVQRAVLDDILSDVGTEFEYIVSNSGQSTHEALRARTSALPQIGGIFLIDTRGRLINSSREFPALELNAIDRDFFESFAEDSSLQRFISQPVRNRATGTWTIHIARRLVAENGIYLGSVVAAIDLNYFERLYGQIAPEPDYVISMFRHDGMLVVRHPARPDSIGQRFKTAGAALISAKGAPNGVLRNTSPIDGLDRLIATRAVAHYPFIMSVSRTAEAGLAGWRQQAWALGSAAALLDAGLLVLIWLGIRQIRGQENISRAEAARSAAEERERGERDLRNQYSRFGIALDNMTQGLCMFDHADGLIVMNERYAGLYGLPEGIRQPGTALATVLARMASGGTCGVGDGPFLAQCRAVAGRPQSASFTEDLPDGRAISVVFEPIPEGGWVWTHEDVTERRRAEALVAHMAHHDSLTGLPNRVMLREHMDRALAKAGSDTAVAVLYLDLDGFKLVNDTLGHLAGDELLQIVAKRLCATVAETDLVSRLGGDEFAIVQSVTRQPGDATALAGRIVETLRTPFEIKGQTAIVGASLGIVLATPGPGAPSADEILRNADIALYRAKADGRNTWRIFERAMDLELQERRVLEADLRKALAGKEFELHYQPLVDARSGQLTGFEALLRWRQPERGYVSPAYFIPLAEEIGMIRPIGAWVLMQACADAVRWPEHVKVAVNLSSVQFLDAAIVDEVEAALAASGLSPRRVELEITESVLLQHNELTVGLLHRLKALGTSISMDDFGTGYSSLSYLHRFPFDKIKIDQGFVRDLERDKDRTAIVRAVVGLGKALGMTVLAEGVETRQQLEILQSEGCDELQGYLFSKPRPARELGDLLAGRFHGTTSPAGPLLVISNDPEGQAAA